MNNGLLCVGCGNRAEGNVNVDAFPRDRDQCLIGWSPKEIEYFVLSHGAFLPFADDSFDVVLARHCLEHFESPLMALREFKRVAKKKVIILVPSEWSHTVNRTHLFSWGTVELRNLMLLTFDRVEVRHTTRLGTFANKSIGSRFYELIANLWLKMFGLTTEIYAVGYL